MPEPIIIESLTLVTLLLYAIDRVKIQPIFDRDPYESRRQELKGSRLVKVLIFYQLIKDPTQRGLYEPSINCKMRKRRSVERSSATPCRMRSCNATSIR